VLSRCADEFFSIEFRSVLLQVSPNAPQILSGVCAPIRLAAHTSLTPGKKGVEDGGNGWMVDRTAGNEVTVAVAVNEVML
jgi:hypothetical protein